MQERKITQVLDKLYMRISPDQPSVDRFRRGLLGLLRLAELKPDESEEFFKNALSEFLAKVFYAPLFYINTDETTDLTIHSGAGADTPVKVMFENKSPGNKAGVPVKLPDGAWQADCRAMQELVLYFMRERFVKGNIHLKHLVITNALEWFVFDAVEFERFFAGDKDFVNNFMEFDRKGLLFTKTENFYRELASPRIKAVDGDLHFVHFDLRDFAEFLQDPVEESAFDIRLADSELQYAPIETLDKIKDLYKLLAPEHMLKLSVANDSNSLNEEFYHELLYIMGLTEVESEGVKLIVRCAEPDRHMGSLLENTIFQLETYKVPVGDLFETALELVITWVNRILFLKLVEAQQMQYHKNSREYSFMNLDRVKDFTELDMLFFQVLAKEYNERHFSVRDKYKQVPYLNSSLFEMSATEEKYFRIFGLRNIELPPFSETVLKDRYGNRWVEEINILQYIFGFLNAYDFASEGTGGVQKEKRTLINAAVLGLIFEQINGYKDGSYFTPGLITEDMCHEVIVRAVLQKFNETKGWAVRNLDELYDKIEDRNEANAIINSVRICDPSVGSGHFLVSALNQLLGIKSELHVLQNQAGKRLKEYTVKIINDEVMIFDDDGRFYEYNCHNAENQNVQEAIFHEKQTLIENCLFGVDINPNSVNICRLRLWIELLKNSYYTRTSGFSKLETLPNIDINIKVGDALVSRFPLTLSFASPYINIDYSFADYLEAVRKYKEIDGKPEKQEVLARIKQMKEDLRYVSSMLDEQGLLKERVKAEIDAIRNQNHFGITKEEAAKRREEIAQKQEDLAALLENIRQLDEKAIKQHAFEWRFEFPEVLDMATGDFVGFDVVVSNPPYIQLRRSGGALADLYEDKGYECFIRKGDIYQLFYERNLQLVKPHGFVYLITSNKWMRAGYGELTRVFLTTKANPLLLVDIGAGVFAHATVDTNLLLYAREPNEGHCMAHHAKLVTIVNELGDDEDKLALDPGIDLVFTGAPWVIRTSSEQRIKKKLDTSGTPLRDWGIKINIGIMNGLNDAFIIDKNKKDELIAADPNSVEIIKPILRGKDVQAYAYKFADLWLLLIRKGTPIEKYPAILKHLEKYKTALMKRKNANAWYELQASPTDTTIANFAKEKLIYREISTKMDACIVEPNILVNNKCYMVTGDHLRYLLAIFNSKLFNRFFLQEANVTGGKGWGFMQKIPVPVPTSEQEAAVTALVEKILAEKTKDLLQADTSVLEAELDRLVYALYGLTDEEIVVVEYEAEVEYTVRV